MNSLIAWVGGKRLLRPKIAELVPTDKISYIEPFGGAAWVLFYKDRWALTEVYNDYDSRLVNLFRVVKYHHGEFLKELRWIVNSREFFTQLKRTEGLTDIQQAARFFYLIRFSFGAKAEHFGTGATSGGAKASPDLINKLTEDVHHRLSTVTIEHLSFAECINKYDHPKAFFYCDPPYTQGAKHQVTFNDEDHMVLAKALSNIKGRFLLSYNDAPEVWEMYEGFTIEGITREKGINRKNRPHDKYKELLIRNY